MRKVNKLQTNFRKKKRKGFSKSKEESIDPSLVEFQFCYEKSPYGQVSTPSDLPCDPR
jgi:hypothetical protein